MTCQQLKTIFDNYLAGLVTARNTYLTGGYPLVLPIGTNGESIGNNLFCGCEGFEASETFNWICVTDPVGICPPCGACA